MIDQIMDRPYDRYSHYAQPKDLHHKLHGAAQRVPGRITGKKSVLPLKMDNIRTPVRARTVPKVKSATARANNVDAAGDQSANQQTHIRVVALFQAIHYQSFHVTIFAELRPSRTPNGLTRAKSNDRRHTTGFTYWKKNSLVGLLVDRFKLNPPLAVSAPVCCSWWSKLG